MTREQIKEVCVDQWIWVKTYNKQYYLDLRYKIYKDYKRRSYLVIHPWDLTKGSEIKIRVKYTSKPLIFCNLLKDSTTGKSRKQSNIGFNKYGIEILSYTGIKDNTGKYYVCCICHHCGNTHVCLEASILSGNTKSCGCEATKVATKRMIERHKKLGHFIYSERNQQEIKEHEQDRSFYLTKE